MKKIEIDDRYLSKKPSKEEIFEKLVGCIKIPSKEKPTQESIKEIWKTQP